ncbi:hypothetical protein M8C21_032050 [Ambrosia artemisiifolia]|uniref:1,4-dihydroxy-2-naphthoyl-CoA synthase n=1 Tax=Ambrosia artemisiifolia TaxID=4212 RepID=A0AAD5C618_AMBAR|nr:hypothetical protein M8C21_032050 [Ambrosia artemisiifolia]
MAAGMQEKDMITVTRRVAAVSNHLSPPQPHSTTTPIITSFNCTASFNDSYHRVHGQVSSHIPVWKAACDETGKEFTDIIYEKAQGEAIAKVQIRRLPKPVIAMVAGYAVGGGHVLHMVCDLTIAADNAIFGQTGPKVGSFDAGYGSSIMSRLVGPKKAREMWFLARFYTAQEAEKMGLINTVVPLEKLEEETVKWCREIIRNSPTAIRVLKSAINAVDDGHAGHQELGGNATLIFYGTEEGNEGKTAYMDRRPPNFSKFPRRP